MVLLIIFTLFSLILGVKVITSYPTKAEHSDIKKYHRENDYLYKNNDENFLDFSGGMFGI